jgi:putative aldouronate transport system substrate-binding protein
MASSNDNIIHAELEKRTGLKLNFQLKPSEGYPQACTTVIASGNYPDAMEYWCGVYPVDLQEMADDGVIRPVDDLIAQYGPEFTKTVRPDGVWFVSSTDGKRYAIPDRVFDFGNNSAMIIRKDWLDKLGLQMPKNSDELFNVFTAFAKNADSLVGAGRRFVPYCPWFGVGSIFLDYFMSENGMIHDWNMVDGKPVHFVNMPAFKTVLQTARKIYQAG